MPVDYDNNDLDLNAADTRCSRDEHIRKVLQFLHLGRILLLDCILDILDPSKLDFMVFQKLFLSNPSGKLTQMLDLIFEDDCGRAHLLCWMTPHATDLLCMKISDEMDDVKRLLGGTLGSITLESLRAWDVNTFIGSVVNKKAPITSHILQTAAQTDHAKQTNKIKTSSTVWKPCLTHLSSMYSG